MNLDALQPYLSITMQVISAFIMVEVITLIAHEEFVRKTILYRVIWIFLFATVYATLPLLGNSYFLKISINVVLVMLFLRFVFELSLKKAALCTAIFTLSISVIEIFIVLLFPYTTHDTAYSYENTIGALTVYYTVFTGYCAGFFLIALIGWLISRRGKKGTGYSKYHLIVFGMALYTVLSEFSVIYVLTDSSTERIHVVLCIVGVAAMLINLIVFYLLGLMIRKDDQLMKRSMADIDANRRLDEYKLTEEKYVSERRQIHEFKNRIQYILELIDKGNFDELRTYATDIRREDFYSSIHFSTNNPVIDIILNDRYEEAKRRNVKLKAYYNDLAMVPLDRDDCIVLFFNLLDNAIEAAEKCVDEKTVEIKIDAAPECTYITVRNTYTRVKRDEFKVLHSTKESPDTNEEHGLGIYNIKSIVDKHNGTYTDEDKDGVFETYIRLLGAE